MFHYLNSALICHYHDRTIGQPGPATPPDGEDDAWQWIEINHMYNCKLWDEEDRARRVDVPPEEIARSKRLIDGYNQARNDAVEAIDEKLLDELAECPTRKGARLCSETPGSMLDRLSILSLKIFHMERQTQRDDASAEHRTTCANKLKRLREQRRDLAGCLDQLVEELAEGRAYFKIYRQFKMYNDPNMNPWLYQRQGTGRNRDGAQGHERRRS